MQSKDAILAIVGAALLSSAAVAGLRVDKRPVVHDPIVNRLPAPVERCLAGNRLLAEMAPSIEPAICEYRPRRAARIVAGLRDTHY